MVEIIKGRLFKWTSAPNRTHQKVAVKLAYLLYGFLEGKPCEVYTAPFDVRLPHKTNQNEEIFTVVQPDISVVCDPSKLDDAGCLGAPEMIVEILSPGNTRKDLQFKYEVYQESGVLEYWIIQPLDQTVLVYSLTQGKFVPSKLFTVGDIVASNVIEGFKLDLNNFFE